MSDKNPETTRTTQEKPEAKTSVNLTAHLLAGCAAVAVGLGLGVLEVEGMSAVSAAGVWTVGVGNLLMALGEGFKRRSQQAGRDKSVKQEAELVGLSCVAVGFVMALIPALIRWLG